MKCKCRKSIKTILSIIIFAFVFGISGMKASAEEAPDSLSYAKQLVSQYYVGSVTETQLNGATDVDSLVKSLNDPYSAYFTKQQYEDFINSINNTFSGIGVQIDKTSDGIKIISVFDGTPAKAAGLEPGDYILKADEHELSSLSVEEAVTCIKGLPGTSVNLQIKRNSSILNVVVERKNIVLPTVKREILDNHIGYIEITSFGENTGTEFKNALTKLKSSSPDSYIIDLRNNGGGYMDTAFDIAGYFIGNNTVLKTQTKSGKTSSYNAVKQDTSIDKPTIFLVNQYSASASEILSAAVKDYKKALFIGEKTYGKGVAQNIFMLPDNSYLKLTTLKFVSPLGHEINKVGIIPDMIVKDDADKNIDSLNAARILLSSINKAGQAQFTLAGSIYNVNLNTAKSTDNINTFSYMAANYQYKVAASGQNSSSQTGTGTSNQNPGELPNTGSFMSLQTLLVAGSIFMMTGVLLRKRE